MTYNVLTPEEKLIIENKATEPPYSGRFDKHVVSGTFICRRCNTPLFSSQAKFDSGCGWPAFDKNFPKAIKRLHDPDGVRTEIQCSTCFAHLGHVFEGEQLTKNNTRHCVNSLSLTFVPEKEKLPTILQNTV